MEFESKICAVYFKRFVLNGIHYLFYNAINSFQISLLGFALINAHHPNGTIIKILYQHFLCLSQKQGVSNQLDNNKITPISFLSTKKCVSYNPIANKIFASTFMVKH